MTRQLKSLGWRPGSPQLTLISRRSCMTVEEMNRILNEKINIFKPASGGWPNVWSPISGWRHQARRAPVKPFFTNLVPFGRYFLTGKDGFSLPWIYKPETKRRAEALKQKGPFRRDISNNQKLARIKGLRRVSGTTYICCSRETSIFQCFAKCRKLDCGRQVDGRLL